MILLDGEKTATIILSEMKQIFDSLPSKLSLNIIFVGNNPASIKYVDKKKRACDTCGVDCTIHRFVNDVSEKELLQVINSLNQNPQVTGILIQLPLPPQIDSRVVLDSVNTDKDIDGLTSYHLLKILLNQEHIIPCTPKGILELLQNYNISLKGKTVCIIGFSDVVGKPLATLCLNRHATVTVCHSYTNNLKNHTISSEIIMTATGVAKLITSDMVSNGSIIIDIGITLIDGKVVGDVDFENVAEKCSYITPVPGGVGPMTVAMVMRNLYECHKLQTTT